MLIQGTPEKKLPGNHLQLKQPRKALLQVCLLTWLKFLLLILYIAGRRVNKEQPPEVLLGKKAEFKVPQQTKSNIIFHI